MKSLFKITICLLILCTVSPSYAELKRYYISPDKKLKAVVITAGEGCKESKIEIYRNGKLLAAENNFSEDCDHGLIVACAEWTKYSRFFVFSMNSSGGHQPWTSHMSFFESKTGNIRSLSKYLPAISDAKFSLKAPDYITLTIWTPFSAEEGILESIVLPVTFRLTDIMKAEEDAQKGSPD